MALLSLCQHDLNLNGNKWGHNGLSCSIPMHCCQLKALNDYMRLSLCLQMCFFNTFVLKENILRKVSFIENKALFVYFQS